MTGLALTDSPSGVFRIARASRGPLDPVPRGVGSDVEGWSRYDTLGRTIYASDDKLTAYMELLAPFRTEISAKKRALQSTADALGISLDTLWNNVVSEWDDEFSRRRSQPG